MAEVESQPIYADFHKIDLGYLRDLLEKNKVSEKVARKLLDYWEMRITEERDPLYSSYFEYYLFFESINSGILSAFVYDLGHQQVKHQYGVLAATTVQILQSIREQDTQKFLAKIEQGYIDIFDYQGEKLSLYLKSIEFGKRTYVIGILYPLNLKINDKLERLVSVFQRYYLPDVFQPDHRFLPLFHELNQAVMSEVTEPLEKKQPVTFTYFKFESFRKYIDLAGEHFASEIVGGLVEQLTTRLKKQDYCYVLNPREYLIVSLNCDKEIIQKRYHRALFQIKSLLLSYQVNYTTKTSPIEDLTSIWHEIATVD